MAFRKMDPERYFRVSRVTAVLLLFLLVFNSLVALYVAPELRVVAQFFPRDLREFSHFNTFSVIETDVKRREQDQAIIDEMLARYYLEMRYTQIPDKQEMLWRWGRGGPVYILSLPSLYYSFAKDLAHKVESLKGVQTIKVVDISSAKGKSGENQFYIRFNVYNHDPQNGRIINTTEKTATLVFVYDRRRIRRGGSFSNPYGFLVINFWEGQKGA